MKKLYLSLFLFSLLLIMGHACEESDGVVGPELGETLIDTTINVSYSDAIISIDQGVTVTIPKGLATGEFKLTIRDVDTPPATPDMMSLIKCFDIKLSIGEEFNDYITIRFDLSSDVFEYKQESDFGFVFYNISEKKWAFFPDYKVDIEENYVECRTNHLTTVGLVEFILSGGYPYKFDGDNITVYYSSGNNAPMSWSEYKPSEQSWHINEDNKNWAPEYIQDIAHYTAEARRILSINPHNLNVSEGNINVYVTDLDGNDGEYGSVSGAMYINNKMKLPNKMSGIKYEDMLKATCAHELMHNIQDNYYVMNKGEIGMWWLEATATQADRMVWGDNLLYSESELYSIESNATLLENLSKSWDDCNNDPNWYLAGSFLQYMMHYRQGGKLNIANSIKNGGTSANLMRVILNQQIEGELGTSLWDEYHDYVLYLFTEGNKKLSAFPHSNNYDEIETAASLTKQVQMSKANNDQTVSVSLPYLSSKLISVSNLENSDLSINYQMTASDPTLEVYLCKVDEIVGKLTIVNNLKDNKGTGDVDLKARSGPKYDKFAILIINTSFTEGSKEAKFEFKTGSDLNLMQLIKRTDSFSTHLRGVEAIIERVDKVNGSESKDTYIENVIIFATSGIHWDNNNRKLIKWSGNTFSTVWDTTKQEKKYTYNVSGTVSADGKTLSSFSTKWEQELKTETVSWAGTVTKREEVFVEELVFENLHFDNFIENSSIMYLSSGNEINQKLKKYHYYSRSYQSVESSTETKITEKIRTLKSLKIKSDSELNLLLLIW